MRPLLGAGLGLAILCSLACAGEPRPPSADSARAPAVAGAAQPGAAPTVFARPSVTVRLADGRAVTFADHGEEETEIRYLDEGPLTPLPFHAVRRMMWEWTDLVLVSLRTGDTTIVIEPPEISPGARRFAITSMDFENGYRPTLMEVWRVDGDRLVREWEMKTGESHPDNTGWGAADLRWTDDSTATFTRVGAHGEGAPLDSAPARLLLRGGKWQVARGGR